MVDEADAAAIEALNAEFSKSLKQRDFAAIGEMYTEDAIIMPPIAGMIAGRGNIEAFWQQASRLRGVSFETASVKSLGDNAIREIGTLRMSMEPREERSDQSEPREVPNKYMLIWQNVGGQWKIETAMWSRIGKPPTARGQGMRIARGRSEPDRGQRGAGAGRRGRGGGLDFMRDD